MNFTPTGKTMFDNQAEMFYHLFMEMGLSINSSQYLYDQETGIELKYKDKFIKADVNGNVIYAGKNDIVFDPARNYNMMVTLIGYYIERETINGTANFVFIAQSVEDNADRTKQRVVVRTNRGDIASQYYKNVYLGFIEVIFLLAENFIPDLSNLDIDYDKM